MQLFGRVGMHVPGHMCEIRRHLALVGVRSLLRPGGSWGCNLDCQVRQPSPARPSYQPLETWIEERKQDNDHPFLYYSFSI